MNQRENGTQDVLICRVVEPALSLGETRKTNLSGSEDEYLIVPEQVVELLSLPLNRKSRSPSPEGALSFST